MEEMITGLSVSYKEYSRTTTARSTISKECKTGTLTLTAFPTHQLVEEAGIESKHLPVNGLMITQTEQAVILHCHQERC